MVGKTELKVRYAETDRMGIAHHSNYPIWFEEARTNFFQELGMSYSAIEGQQVLLPLIEFQCKFIEPLRYEDVFIIYTKIKEISPVKIHFEYEMYQAKTLKTKGITLHAFTDRSLKPVNLKKVLPDLYVLLQKSTNAN